MKDWQVHVALARRERALAIASFGRAIRHWWREKMIQWFGIRDKRPLAYTARLDADGREVDFSDEDQGPRIYYRDLDDPWVIRSRYMVPSVRQDPNRAGVE